MKNVIFISYYFPPIHSVESTMALNSVKYLPDFGWTPIVITAEQASKRGIDLETINNIPSNIIVHRTYSREGIIFRILNRLKLIPDDVIGWLPFALKTSRIAFKNKPIRAIISRAYPITSHIVAQQLKSSIAQNLPWIVLFSDPWTQNPYVSYPNVWTKRHHEAIERRILSTADKIVVTTKQTKKLLTDKYDINDKVVVLPNTYDSTELDDQLRHVESEPKWSRFTIVYTGNFYGLRSPEPLFKAIRLLINRRPELTDQIQVRLVGSIGPFKHLIMRYKLRSVVQLINLLPRKEMFKEVARSDILLLIDAPSRQDSIFLPAKLIEYIKSQKPIIGITPPGASADVIYQTKTGKVVSPVDISAITQAISDYYDLYKKSNLRIYPDWSEIEKYSASQYAHSLSQLLDSLIQK